MIHIVSWFWGCKYPIYFITKLRDALKCNIKQPYTFNVVSHGAWLKGPGFNSWSIADEYLLNEPGCIVRLRLFDWKWLEAHNIKKGELVVNLDIDSIVVSNLDPLFNMDMYSFRILQGINTTNPNPYNGSLWAFRAGEYDHVWQDFSLEALRQVPKHAIYDDQAWIWAKIPYANAWGPEQGVYGFKKHAWPSGDNLPENARLVTFPGRRDPRKLGHIPWVDANWKAVHKMTKEELRGQA